MIINIEQIGENGLHVRTSRKPEWVTNIPEISDEASNIAMEGDVVLDFRVDKILNEISVKGKIGCVIHCLCSRCLESVRIALTPEINLLLSPGNSDKDRDSNMDFENYQYGEEEIDLSEYLKERIAISMPVKIVCNNDCRGLCSRCGTNLNYENCNCETEWVDPRFAKLKNLKV